MDISEIRLVKLHWLPGKGYQPATEYMMHRDHVGRFVEATKCLHHSPGVNPHNGEQASKIYRITVAELEERGPFWWTVPDLQNNGDPRGAKIIGGAREVVAWQDEVQIASWDVEQAESEVARRRQKLASAREVVSSQSSQSSSCHD